ncbi:Cna B-type domain-containing protein [Enterococcus sp. LJL99]
MKKLLTKLGIKNYKWFFLAIVLIFLFLCSIFAPGAEAAKNDSYIGNYDPYNKEDSKVPYVINPDGSKIIAYCFNHDRSYPEKISYTRYELYEGITKIAPKDFDNLNYVVAAMFAGSPENNVFTFSDNLEKSYTAYKKEVKTNITIEQFQENVIQQVMWSILSGTKYYDNLPYRDDLFNYAKEHPISQNDYSIENLKFKDMNGSQIDSSNPLRINPSTKQSQIFVLSNYKLPIKISSLPSNYKVVDQNEQEATLIYPEKQYKVVVKNSQLAFDSGELSFLALAMDHAYFYASSNGKYQNLISGQVKKQKITIPITVGTKEIQGEKIWQDFDNKLNTRPESIVVDLYQNNSLYATQEIKDQNGKWLYHFADLPAVDSQGKEYSYTVKEEPVDGYKTTISDDGTITNTYVNQEKINLAGKKIWQDYDDKFNTRPAKITVRLFQNNQEIAQQDVIADATGNWIYQFKDLAKYDTQGNEYVYTVKEDYVKDYNTTVDGTTITNTYTNTEKTSLSGKKIWQDNNNKLNKRPTSITVHLLQNGTPIKQAEVKADDAGNWAYHFDNLAKYDSTGDVYQYTVKEDPVDGYTTTIDGTTITNTYENKEKTTITGQKIWQDNNNQHDARPTSITVRLFQNGKEIDHTEVTAGNDAQWTYEFVDLPKYDADGDAYTYTVTEDAVENYETIIDGTTITNVYNHKGLLPDTGGDKRQLIITIGAFVLILAVSWGVFIYYQNRKGGIS